MGNGASSGEVCTGSWGDCNCRDCKKMSQSDSPKYCTGSWGDCNCKDCKKLFK